MALTWPQINAEIERLAGEPDEAPDPITIENAKLFLEFSFGRYSAPDEIHRGYWPTICMSWSLDPNPIEIEVFADRFEFYRFFDGATEIKHVPIEPGTIPVFLQTLLEPLLSKSTLDGGHSQ